MSSEMGVDHWMFWYEEELSIKSEIAAAVKALVVLPQ
jgi:hypothetical protein